MFLRKKSSTLALGSLLILSGAALAQSQPNASKIIKQVSATYKNLRSFHFEAQFDNEERKDGAITRSGSKRVFASDDQDRKRIEYKIPSFEFLRLFDGVTKWTYFPESREYREEVLKNLIDFADGFNADFFITRAVISDLHTRYAQPDDKLPPTGQLKAMRSRPMETIKIGDQTIPVFVVEIEYSLVPAEGRDLRRTLWIDQRRFIVLRDLAIRKETRDGKTTEKRTLVNLTVAKVNEALPSDLFTFKPSPDARQVKHPSALAKDLGDLDLRSNAMYASELNAINEKSAIPAGIPGGVGIPPNQKAEPFNPFQLLTPGVEAGKPIKKAQPRYSDLLVKARVSGIVYVRITIDEKGKVIDAVVTSGHPLLRDVSLNAARQWKFEPTLLDGKPIKVQGVLTFTFSLR